MFKLFANNFESAANKDLARDKTKDVATSRHLEKDRYLGEAPLFKDEEAIEDEELVNANDPEKRFVPINEVPDRIDEIEEEGEKADIQELKTSDIKRLE